MDVLNRTEAPAFVPFESFPIKRAQKGQLSNRIKTHTIHVPLEPVVQVEWIFSAGNVLEAKPGVAQLCMKMLQEGTANADAKIIAEKLAYFGAHLELSAGATRTYVTLYALNKYIEPVVELVHEMIFNSVFPKSNFENLKNIMVQQARVNQEKTAYLATGHFRSLLFGANHPYGYFLSPEQIESIQYEDVFNHYRHHIQIPYVEILIAGDVQASVQQAIEKVYSQSTLKEAPLLDIEAPIYAPEHKMIYKEESIQSSIRVGKRMIPKNHPDYLPLLLTIELLGGFFGSRLMKNIREDKGYTYGIYAGLNQMGSEMYLVIGTDVNKENTQNTLREIEFEIKQLQTSLAAEEELEMVKNHFIGNFYNSITTPFSLADKTKNILFNHLPEDFYEYFVERIQQIGAENIQKMAIRYLQWSEMTTVVAGGV